MTHPLRRTILAAAALATVTLASCASPFPGIQFTPEETTTPTGQTNAPYPTDLDHLDNILALGKTALPDGAINITITPATKFAESYPGGWGYVIAYHAEPQPIRNHIDKYTSHSGDGIEDYPDTKPPFDVEDIDVTNIQHPWITGLGKVQLVVERPLGRCWLLIRGAPR